MVPARKWGQESKKWPEVGNGSMASEQILQKWEILFQNCIKVGDRGIKIPKNGTKVGRSGVSHTKTGIQTGD